VNADMVGVQSGVTTLVDQGGPSCMTLPGFRHFIAEKAQSRTYAFLSAYLVGGLEGHYYPNLYSPDGVDIDATVKAATANRDLVRGIKAHAEIGGFARWGIRVIEMAPRSDAAPIFRSMCISASSGACRRAAPMARMSIPFSSA
jgi:dihydroorotase